MEEENQTVIVTGGSRGLGLATVSELLKRGYKVTTCSRSRSTELKVLEQEYDGRLMWFEAEIGREKDEINFVESAIEWSDKDLWGLVNNAGVAGEGILATFPSADVERILKVNLLGGIRMSRLVSRQLLTSDRGGRIINVSSIVGLRGYSGLAPYSASKAGLDGMTRALARELGRRNITVNSVAPGYFESAISESLGALQRNQIVRRTPLGRLATVNDLVPAITFLLSESASFITGHTLVVDGGITA